MCVIIYGIIKLRMKKLILLLISLSTFTCESYASSPVTETQQTEIIEVITVNSTEIRNNNSWIYSVSSFLMGILGWLFVGMLIGGAMGGSPDSALDRFFIFYIISSVGAVLLGGVSVIKKSKGYILGVLGALSGALLLSLIIFSR